MKSCYASLGDLLIFAVLEFMTQVTVSARVFAVMTSDTNGMGTFSQARVAQGIDLGNGDDEMGDVVVLRLEAQAGMAQLMTSTSAWLRTMGVTSEDCCFAVTYP
ncbi:uncharacterized protein BCR38DRAFT_432874 [Pseudomassariella vexata]|uniref:Uncharacterized protein n=1 Tax=Pseudomassariella vexata TaxID=1141098 RepID=A0A1Y2E1Y2_9PEZI|nr:uncharacterized protein BCR38DRAFT_432874 [Pseudomassariella vexata]ORY65467.1 hypothetical protein BCR38DRAFT_432874 [Pseudomassariella vexata]